MTNDPVLIAYTVTDRPAGQKSIWRRIGVEMFHKLARSTAREFEKLRQPLKPPRSQPKRRSKR